ncbi:hypothetical protein [Microbacterium immunditiarum]|uniref:Uncharacterized protein n=1 Tax=Microbacterium immunditiarum TaxID=337480 RepID=A0A7Y9GLP4_9MICO|nr:hypothetical protein [Microbacterium immunditiarum]NYE18766.1 hypothetical protein [Microbacterium immunditiarum]
MDAADRAELDALRRRAYGPSAETLEAKELARLVELEDRVRAEHAPVASGAGDGAPGSASGGGGSAVRDDVPNPSDAGAAAGVRVLARPAEPSATEVTRPGDGGGGASASPTGDPAGTATRSKWSRRRTLVVAGIAVIVVGAAVVASTFVQNALRGAGPTGEVDYVDAPEAYSFTRDLTSTVLLRIPLDGSFGSFVDLPDSEAPPIPSSGTVEWVEPLGEYYGWNVWIAGAQGAVQREHCIVIEREDRARGRCVPAVLREQSALVAPVPYAWIPDDERPEEMSPGQRLGFWWGGDNGVIILIGDTPQPR